MPESYNVGSIVRTRNREWVVLPSSDKDLLLLRPLGGSEKEISGVYLPLNLEKIEPATFPQPDPNKVGDLTSIKLLRDAARLTFRSGAGPFRSMGRISVRPRPYQLVPLLMALRQDPIRLLIADDVGVGKTIEALLIARELYDRGEIRSIGVICPPHLCDQWQKELELKFNINAVVIKSNTISQLERKIPDNISVFKHYQFFVTSVDYAKSESYKDNFLLNLPDLVIVDEAHTCTKPIDNDKTQQQRYELINDIASKDEQNLVLLTATPHSGKEEVFLSLLGHLKKEFVKLNLSQITPDERKELAKYFVQRTRGDVEKWIDVKTDFPKRLSIEKSYNLSNEYSALFKDAYYFTLSILASKDKLAEHKQRIRYWAALALLRSIMSSPDSGIKSLMNRITKLRETELIKEEFDDSIYQAYVTDPVEQETTNDLEPSTVVEAAEEDLTEPERRKLREFANRLEKLKGDKDEKLQKVTSILTDLCREGFKPIVFCRFIATAEYVASQLKPLFPKHQIYAITSELAGEEREGKIKELGKFEKRILIATDCLSEGVNLQEYFDAVIHYDLPWNPNRLEQREGRVDRFGQNAPEVKAIILYGEDNPIDGAVLNVLIRKAVKIHQTLGITVPVPMNSETVIQSVINSLFVKDGQSAQLALDFGPEFQVESLHKDWDRDAERQKESRGKFRQSGIEPNEVAQELKETDFVLGEPETVREFIISSTQRLGGTTTLRENSLTLNPNGFPQILREKIKLDDRVNIAFDFPIPENHIEVGRNHPITSSLSDYVIESAFESENQHRLFRSSVVRTDKVDSLSTFYFLRIRYLIDSTRAVSSLLAEELGTFGYSGNEVIPEGSANELLNKISAEENVDPDQAKEIISETLIQFNNFNSQIEEFIKQKAERLREAHSRLRRITKEGRVTVKPQLPVDVLGIVVLLPIPKGVKE